MASSRVTRRGDVNLGWFAPHTFEQGRHFVEITSWPSRVDSLHGVSNGSFVPDRPAAIPYFVAPQVAFPTPFHCAFVRVWSSPRQLGPPSPGLLCCWDPWTKGLPETARQHVTLQLSRTGQTACVALGLVTPKGLQICVIREKHATKVTEPYGNDGSPKQILVFFVQIVRELLLNPGRIAGSCGHTFVQYPEICGDIQPTSRWSSFHVVGVTVDVDVQCLALRVFRRRGPLQLTARVFSPKRTA